MQPSAIERLPASKRAINERQYFNRPSYKHAGTL